jgi:hypothetical protein
MRTGDTQLVVNAVPNIYLEIQTPSPEDVSSRIVKFHLDEQLYGGSYEFWLDDSDSGLATKDYVGYRVELELGFVGGTRSVYHYLWVEKQDRESVAGKLLMKVTCMDIWGLMASVNSTVGAQYWNYPELAPAEPNADAAHYDKTIEEMVTSLKTSAVGAYFGISKDDDDGYYDTLKPPIRVTNVKEGIYWLMGMTDSYLLFKNDHDFHVIQCSKHSSVYTFALGSSTLWQSSEESSSVIPNLVVYHGRTAAGVDLDSGTYGEDATSFVRVGLHIPKHYFADRMEVGLISDQTLLNNLAASTILKIQGEASQGTLYAPMHCSLELLDKITITDTRYSGTKTITGYAHRIVRDYEANKGVYSIQVAIGGASSSYTPGGANPLIAKADAPVPVPFGYEYFYDSNKILRGFIHALATGTIGLEVLAYQILMLEAGTKAYLEAGDDIIISPGSGKVVDINTHKITKVVDPTSDQDVATKKYVDTHGGLTDIVNDTTPQLGGDLSTNNNKVNIDYSSSTNKGWLHAHSDGVELASTDKLYLEAVTDVYIEPGAGNRVKISNMDTTESQPTRAIDTVYQNTTGKLLMVTVTVGCNASSGQALIGASNPPTTVVANPGTVTAANTFFPTTFIVPVGYYYEILTSSGVISKWYWTEWTIG